MPKKADRLTPSARAYVAAALWASTDEDGEPLDRAHDIGDIAPESLDRMIGDWEAFRAANAADISATAEYVRGCELEQAAHDFWLTRNWHGAGFRDRGYPDDLGERLTKAAKAAGRCELYIGDDGEIHCCPSP